MRCAADAFAVQPEKIKKLLNNPSTGQVGTLEKTDGMKYLLAQMSVGRDVSEYFPDVVKNVIVRCSPRSRTHCDANAPLARAAAPLRR